MPRRTAMRFLYIAAVLGLLAWVWFRGVLGSVLVTRLAPCLLPYAAGDDGEVTAITFRDVPLVPARGVVLQISPPRLRAMIRQALGGIWFVPPGIVREGLLIEGLWLPEGVARKHAVPVSIACTARAGLRPTLVARYPVGELNALLKEDLAHKMVREKEYTFGHYDLAQRWTFYSAAISTTGTNEPSQPGRLTLNVQATGRVRYAVADGILSAKAAVDVRRLRGRVLVQFVQHEDGVGIEYEVVCDELKVQMSNLAPWAERKVADTLRESLERSANKRRKRERMARQRLPGWVPYDLEVDVQLTDDVQTMPSGDQ